MHGWTGTPRESGHRYQVNSSSMSCGVTSCLSPSVLINHCIMTCVVPLSHCIMACVVPLSHCILACVLTLCLALLALCVRTNKIGPFCRHIQTHTGLPSITQHRSETRKLRDKVTASGVHHFQHVLCDARLNVWQGARIHHMRKYTT